MADPKSERARYFLSAGKVWWIRIAGSSTTFSPAAILWQEAFSCHSRTPRRPIDDLCLLKYFLSILSTAPLQNLPLTNCLFGITICKTGPRNVMVRMVFVLKHIRICLGSEKCSYVSSPVTILEKDQLLHLGYILNNGLAFLHGDVSVLLSANGIFTYFLQF